MKQQRIPYETISMKSGSRKRVCHICRKKELRVETTTLPYWREIERDMERVKKRMKNLIITTNSGEPVPQRVYSISKRKLMHRFYLGDVKIRLN